MNRDDRIRMAIEAGWDLHQATCDTRIKEFAELVARAEREACANLVDHILKEGGGTWGDAIRARGELNG